MASQTMLLAIVAITAVGQTLVFTLLPSLGRAAGLWEVQVGLIISCSSLVFALASPVWGGISDSLGRKTVLVIGLCGYSLGTLLFALVFDAGIRQWLTGPVLLAALVLTRMLQAAVMAATPAAAAAYTADITAPRQRTAGMARISAANNLGTIIGPVSGGLLAVVTLAFPLYVVSVITAVMALLVALLLPQSPHQPQPRRFRFWSAIGKALRAYADPRLRDLLAIGAMVFLSFALIQQTLGFLYQDYFALSPALAARALGLTMMAAALTSLLAQLLVVQWLKAPPLMLLVLTVPALGIGAGLLWLGSERYQMTLAVVMLGLALGFAMPGVMSLASLRVDSGEQGRVAGLASACPALGFILGPLLGTALYTVGPRLPYLLVLALILPLSWMVLRLARRVN